MATAPRTALVIGASSRGGLGEASARRLHDDGFRIILAGRNRRALDDLSGELAAKVISCDITDESAIAAMVAESGPVDVVVNASGTTLGQSILKIRREQIEAQLAIHVVGNILLLKHVAPVMARGGSIILFSSVTAELAGHGLVAYGSAKAGLDHVVRIAAIEFGALGIRVNAVAPGFTRTPMTEGFLSDEKLNALYRRESAMGELTQPEQVAAAVSYLAASDCFSTGAILPVSGGAQLHRLPRLDEIRQ
jgi:NAD(P)-dependent dehydrogenase (short-subunit alcohol dehydrogenase family)